MLLTESPDITVEESKALLDYWSQKGRRLWPKRSIKQTIEIKRVINSYYSGNCNSIASVNKSIGDALVAARDFISSGERIAGSDIKFHFTTYKIGFFFIGRPRKRYMVGRSYYKKVGRLIFYY